MYYFIIEIQACTLKTQEIECQPKFLVTKIQWQTHAKIGFLKSSSQIWTYSNYNIKIPFHFHKSARPSLAWTSCKRVTNQKVIYLTSYYLPKWEKTSKKRRKINRKKAIYQANEEREHQYC